MDQSSHRKWTLQFHDFSMIWCTNSMTHKFHVLTHKFHKSDAQIPWSDAQIPCKSNMFVFKIFNGPCPSYLSEHLRKVSDFHIYNTLGSSENFAVPHVSGHASTTFFFNGIKEWKSLPSDIKRVETFNRFKTSVKRFLNSQMQLMEADIFCYHWFLLY